MNHPQRVNNFPVVAFIDTTPAINPGGLQTAVVVCDRGITWPDRFVTWRIYERAGSPEVHAEGGFYTDSRAEAIGDMIERSGFAVELTEATA